MKSGGQKVITFLMRGRKAAKTC
jgi:ABC-type uncharacterized transport system YnjBCD ATPase subunit